jgi:hypothetical protein
MLNIILDSCVFYEDKVIGEERIYIHSAFYCFMIALYSACNNDKELKMKHFRSFLLSLLVALLLFSSCSVSRQFTTQFNKEKIDDHIHWYSLHTDDLNGAPAFINVLDIDLKRYEGDIVLAWYRDTLIRTSDIAREHNAIAALNGSFFDMRVGGSVLFLQESGEVIAETHDRIAFINEGAYAKDTSGTVMILKRPESDWTHSPAHADIMVSGPLMIYDHAVCELDSVRFNITRHPRTAIGITEDRRFLLVTVDGRHAEAAGMSMWELQALMLELGCKDALNFDGGGSTTMYIRGMTETGVVNCPSDNRKFDNEGERRVANAIVVKKDR